MPCYFPLQGWRSKAGRNKVSGRWPIVFDKSQGYVDLPVEVPCGKCVGCKIEKIRQWAIRCVFEASMHEDNCFITLTYNNENLPEKGTLVKKDIQTFIKKIRKKYKYKKKIKYFLCGEYGDDMSRPHYHICLFNYDFKDKYFFKKSEKGSMQYKSDTLDRIWKKGFALIGDVNFDSAGYIAKYICKKITDADIKKREEKKKERYGEKIEEFVFMSKRPTIGREWYEEFKDDIIRLDRVVLNKDIICKPPKYFDNILEKEDIKKWHKMKGKRKKEINEEENTWERRVKKAQMRARQLKKLKRSYENETAVCNL